MLDGIEDTAHRLVSYNIDPIPATDGDAVPKSWTRARDRSDSALQALEANKPMLDHCIEINRLENEADSIGRNAIGELFNNETDPLTVIKLKEIYEFLEHTIDSCEDVADALQNVVVKNS